MTLSNGLWHVLGLILPALWLASLTALLAKWWWPTELSGVARLRLCAVCTLGAVLGNALCIAWLGQDGRMLAYAAMVLCCALSTWWFARAPS